MTGPTRSTGVGGDVDDEMLLIGSALAQRADGITKHMAAAVRSSVDFYKHDYSPSPDSVLASCRANLRFVIDGLDPTRPPDVSKAIDTGEERAQGGVPLHGLVAAHRVAGQEVWQALQATFDVHDDLSRTALLVAVDQVARAQHVYVETGAAAHRQRSILQALDDEAQHRALVEALFLGTGSPGRSVWEVAELLRIPRQGPYVVVALRHSMTSADPELIGRLRSVDLYSVWRTLPDLQVGIVCIPTVTARERLLRALTRWAREGAGVSPEFEDLQEVSTAQHYACTVIARATAQEPVVTVSGAALELVALVDPQISRRLAVNVLGALNELDHEERTMLQQTFATWTVQRGSIVATAEALFCHPNTVRYRLNRIEQLTGRSVRAPVELAELCLAFEIAAKLPPAF